MARLNARDRPSVGGGGMRVNMAVEAGDLAAFNGRNGDTYVVSASQSGNLYCSCPAWRFQSKHPDDRQCKHITEYVANIMEVKHEHNHQ